MWIGVVLVVGVYVPAAVKAFASDIYLASSADTLVAPSGEQFDVRQIERISVRKTFWHKLMIVRSGGVNRKVVVTFARPDANGIREALRNDPHLLNVSVT